jgi:hypothetical protein
MGWMLSKNAVKTTEWKKANRAHTLRARKPLQIISLMLTAISMNVQAADFYAGVDVAPVVYWQEHPPNYYSCCSSYSSEQDSTSLGFGAHAGQWVWEDPNGKVGWEIGYANLGSINGSTTYTGSIPATTGQWKYSATAVYAAISAEGILKENRLLSRIGIYKSTAQGDGSYVTSPGTYSVETSGAGFILGVGYGRQLTKQVAWLVNADGYIDVKLVDPASPTDTISQSILKVSLGLEYSF